VAVKRGKRASAVVPIDVDDRKAAKALKRLVTHFKRSATEINSALELANKGWRVISAVPAAIARQMIDATRAANAYGKAVAEVTTIASDAEFPIAKIRDITFEMAALYGGDATSNAKALYQAISAGATDATQATEILHAANKLAIGGVTDVTTAVDGLTNVVNAYSAQGLKAADASDTLFIAIRDGKTNAQELATTLGQVAPLAAQLDVPFHELAAAVAAATGPGVSTAEAVTQVRSALVGIVKETPKAKRAAKELGLEFNTSALRAKGLRGFLDDVARSGATEQQLLALFGRVEGLNAVMTLTANEGQRFTEILDDMRGRSGATDEAFRKMTRTLDFQVTRFGALKNAAQIALGQTVTDSKSAYQAMAAINSALEDIIDWIQSPGGAAAVDDFVKSLAGLASVLLTAFAGVSKALGEVSMFIKTTDWEKVAKWSALGPGGIAVGAFATGGFDNGRVIAEPAGKTLSDHLNRLGDMLDNIANGRGRDNGFGRGGRGGRNIFTPRDGRGGGGTGGGGAGAGGGGDSIDTLTPEERVRLGAFGIGGLDFADRTSARRGAAPAFDPTIGAGGRTTARGARESGVTPSFLGVLGLPTIDQFGQYFSQLGSNLKGSLQAMGQSVSDFGSVIGSTLGAALQGVGAAFAEMLVQWDTGAFKEKLGDVLVGLGTMLIQTGFAASVLGALSFIPGLQLVTGPPGLAVAGGLLAATAGAGMILAGKALGGGGQTSAPVPSLSAGGGGASGGRSSPSPGGFNPAFAGANGAGAAPQEVHLHFPGFVGDRRRAAREATDALREYGALQPFGAAGS
jgi:TP901 family phage tail tape measure protein